MIKKSLCALCSGDSIVYQLKAFISEGLSRQGVSIRYERVYPDGKIQAPDSNDLEQIQFVLFHEGILSLPYPVF